MSNTDYNQDTGSSTPYVNKCKDPEVKKNRPTRKSIIREREKVCNLLFESVGTVGQSKERVDRETEIYQYRKCLYVRTEANYQRYRNFDVFVSSELVTFNDTVKGNVGIYNKTYKDLNETLKNIAKATKELKTKVTDLKDAGAKLYNCFNDDCNKTQRRALTGRAHGCEDTKPGCPGSDDIIRELIYIPVGLMQDADILFKSAYEVVGIQTFTNPESLENLQKNLETNSKKLTDKVTETSKAREGDLKKQQDEMVKSVKEIEKAELDLNHNRSVFEGYKDAAEFLCKQPCRCGDDPARVEKHKKDREKLQNAGPEVILTLPILELCQQDICDICKIIDDSFCCEPEETPTPTPKPPPPTTEC
ncbi:MAG: hypothetical protein JNK79_06690 [Chitinophagaceae bacterium]|nr:hypothetical protein [Chitinophagaceae bacterium]